MLKMGPFGPDFLTSEHTENNSLAKMISVKGFIVLAGP